MAGEAEGIKTVAEDLIRKSPARDIEKTEAARVARLIMTRGARLGFTSDEAFGLVNRRYLQSIEMWAPAPFREMMKRSWRCLREFFVSEYGVEVPEINLSTPRRGRPARYTVHLFNAVADLKNYGVLIHQLIRLRWNAFANEDQNPHEITIVTGLEDQIVLPKIADVEHALGIIKRWSAGQHHKSIEKLLETDLPLFPSANDPRSCLTPTTFYAAMRNNRGGSNLDGDLE